MPKRIIVAIDGPAGAGKSTIARRLAERLGFVYIDSGAMYRAVALWALRTGVDSSDLHRLEQLARAARIEFEAGRTLLNGEDVTAAIRAPEVAACSSRVSAVPGVRRAMVDEQRRLAAEKSVVMEGRDIGSVVFPEALVKVFLDASADIRASRRALDLDRQGRPEPVESVARELAERDERDRSRPESPLVQSPDAVYIDSSQLDLDGVEQTVLKVIRDRTSNGKELEP